MGVVGGSEWKWRPVGFGAMRRRISIRGDARHVGDPRPRGGPAPSCPGRAKRWKTRRERDAARFGGMVPSGERRGAGPPPRRLPPLWGGRPPGSPLAAPKTVVITQSRLCQHRGLFNHEVKSVNVERLLSPGPVRSDSPVPGGPSPVPQGARSPVQPPSPPEASRGAGQEGVPADLSPRVLAGRLRALLGCALAFPGRDLASERRRGLLAALLRHHRALPDLAPLLAHRNHSTEAAPPGCWSPRSPEQEPSGSAGQGDFGDQKQSWELTPPYCSTPGPVQAIADWTLPYPAGPGTPSPIFGGDRKKRETPFSWTSGEEEEDDPRSNSPALLFQPPGEGTPPWGDPHRRGGPLPHGGLLPGSPPVCTCGGPPAPPPTAPAFGEDVGEGCSWGRAPPIAPLAFSPLAPRHRHAPRRSVTVSFAPRRLEPCCGAGPDPRTPDAWSPEASRRLGFAPGWPQAERQEPCRCHRHDPPRHGTFQFGSRRPSQPSGPPSPVPCCWQPLLEHGAPPETRRQWDREERWDAPGPGCRWGLGQPGWPRALRHLPLSCFPPLEWGGSPLPSPERWGCPCAGLCWGGPFPGGPPAQ
ncbi:proline-rich protein 19 [Athene noctua]|uniref:proline-rich protein 19 n=1 Tax=Athene noctua TaxID=126797 RepID=UPI003EBBCAC4